MRGVLLLLVFAMVCPTFAQSPARVKDLPVETVSWRSVGPGGGGWIQSILPSRHRTERLFVGCDVGGFYLSEDGGRTYEMRNHGLQNLWIETIVEHPTQPETLFVGSIGGLYRTRDLGRTWTELRNGFPKAIPYSYSMPVSKILFSSTNPDCLYAAIGQPRTERNGRGALYRSQDGGESWSLLPAPGQLANDLSIYDFLLDVDGAGTVLISTQRGIFRSEDGGTTWHPSNQGLPSTLRTRHLAHSRVKPNVVYVTLRQKGGEKAWQAGVYRSEDGGKTWRPRNNGFKPLAGTAGMSDMLCSWVDRIVVHPSNPEIVYAGGATWWTPGIYKTTNGGASWSLVFFKPDQGWLTEWGASVTALSMSETNPEILAFGNSGYVYRTTNGGTTWRQGYTAERTDGCISGNGLEVTCLHSLVADRSRKGRFFLNYFDIGLMITDDDGKRMTRCLEGIPSAYRNSCFSVVQSPSNPSLVWGGFGTWSNRKGIVARSTDGGRSWVPCTKSGNGWVSAAPRFLQCLENPLHRLFCVAAGRGLVFSPDGGDHWEEIPETSLPGARRVQTLQYADGVLYAGVAGGKGKTSLLYKSADAGERWQLISPADVRWGNMTQIAVRGSWILITLRQKFENHLMFTGGAVFSSDGGKTWRQIFKDTFCEAALITMGRLLISLHDHPFHDHAVGGGILCSQDQGKSWSTLNSPSLMNWNVTSLLADPFDPAVVWAGTAGNSIFVGRLRSPREGSH